MTGHYIYGKQRERKCHHSPIIKLNIFVLHTRWGFIDVDDSRIPGQLMWCLEKRELERGLGRHRMELRPIF